MANLYVKNKLEQINREGYGLHLEGVLSAAFDIHKKSIIPGFVATLIYVFVMVALNLSMFEARFGMNMTEFVDTAQRNPAAIEAAMQNIPFSNMLMFGLAGAVVGSLIAPLLSGMYKTAFNTQFGANGSVSDLFAYYKSPYFLKIVIFSFLYSFLLQLINLGLEEVLPGLGSLIGVLVTIVFGVTFILVIPFMVFGNLSLVDSVKASMLVTSKNWFFLLFILAISFIIVIIGVFFCGIGILFTYPFMYFVTFVLYDKIIGFPSNIDEISEIGLP